MIDRLNVQPLHQNQSAQAQYGAPLANSAHLSQADSATLSKQSRAYLFGYQQALQDRSKRNHAVQP